MSERKSKDKNNGKKEKDSLKEELGFTEDSIMDEDEVVEDDFIESIEDEEDNPEFMNEVMKFEKEHSNSKVVTVHKKIGSPKFKKLSELKKDKIQEEYKRIMLLLDEHNIIVHFHNDYPVSEKYRFVTEEIFKEAVEEDKKNKNSHISFIYEDFHPEMDDDEEEDF
ncbi:MAG: hypothetical protein JSS63_10220 [Bacteroidetes bacterium]|nr:hypothetical protein [Bacteroidota bacterium]MBX7047049.1 hypothetical protein [Ignavibacteria bacterium]